MWTLIFFFRVASTVVETGLVFDSIADCQEYLSEATAEAQMLRVKGGLSVALLEMGACIPVSADKY